jgi:hypothetical protein
VVLGDVAVLGRAERPNLVGLDAVHVEVPERIVLVSLYRDGDEADEADEAADCVLGDLSLTGRRPDRGTFADRGDDLGLLGATERVHPLSI